MKVRMTNDGIIAALVIIITVIIVYTVSRIEIGSKKDLPPGAINVKDLGNSWVQFDYKDKTFMMRSVRHNGMIVEIDESTETTPKP